MRNRRNNDFALLADSEVRFAQRVPPGVQALRHEPSPPFSRLKARQGRAVRPLIQGRRCGRQTACARRSTLNTAGTADLRSRT